MKSAAFCFLALTLWLSHPALAAAPAPFSPPSENIALHKPYKLSPAPNYKLCSDPGDRAQLTDGVYSKGYFWTQKETVGWQNTRPVIITIDLGRPQPIRGASFTTAAGKAGVHWPQAIFLVVSDDGKTWREAGELMALDLAHGRPAADYEVHRFWTADLKTRGRYAVIVVSATDYTFVDEIEIYKGEDAWLSQPLAGEAFDTPNACYLAGAQRACVQRRLRDDAQALRENVNKIKPAGEMGAIIQKGLDRIDAAIPSEAGKKIPADFRAVLPVSDFHKAIFRIQALLWRAAGMPGLTAWTSNPYEPLQPIHEHILEKIPAIELALMQNETRAAVLNLSSTTDADTSVMMRITGIEPCWIKVHQAEWTDTAAGQPVLAALPDKLQQAGTIRRDKAGKDIIDKDPGYYVIDLHGGLTRQVWLSVRPPVGGAGTYQGQIIIDGVKPIPFTLRVSRLRFPDQPALHLGGWDYTDTFSRYATTPENRAALIAHLREHYVDSPWGSASLMPFGKYGPDGRMTAPPDTAKFDAWLGLWPGARQYMVFASVPDHLDRFKMGTTAFDAAVKEWIAFWAGHAKKRGLRPEQLNVLLVDEPRNDEMDARLLAWMRPCKAAATGVRLWVDPTHENPYKANQEMMALADVLCPNRPRFLNTSQYPNYGKYYAEARPKTELAFYSCSGPARLLDPYSYYRLQGWECWRHGAKAMYWWAFADTGEGSSWNEYAARRTAYTPLFLDGSSVTAGKAMEAIREGVEDYEYFVMLKNAVEKAEKAGLNEATLQKAKSLLTTAAPLVLDAQGASGINWSDPKDRSIADQVRLEILDVLEKLM